VSPPVCMVRGSREVLRGAIENVVRNAVRHTKDLTGVDIAIRPRLAKSGPVAEIVVRDHGVGVPSEFLNDLFEPFRRKLDQGSLNPDGSGLGLAITKRTFEVHGGAARAANGVGGEGLVVTLELPLLETASAAA